MDFNGVLSCVSSFLSNSGVSTAIGAIIGTYGGVYFIGKNKERKNRNLRKLAISALELIKSYAKDNQTFKDAESAFNNKFKIAQKRAILVLLHKIGIPIIIPVKKSFNIKRIEFFNEKIDAVSLDEMRSQIAAGYCDNLFYIDAGTYFNDEIVIKTKRYIALRYIDEVLCDPIFQDGNISFKSNWHENFSEGEFNTILVFRAKNLLWTYYDKETRTVNQKNVDKLKEDVERGLWDEYLNWDIDAYNNMIAQKNMAGLMSQAIQAQQQTQPPPILTPQALEQLAQILPQQLAQLQANTSQQEIANDTK